MTGSHTFAFHDVGRTLDEASQEEIAELSNLLFELDAAGLDAAASAHRRTSALELSLAIIQRAGATLPPGLSRARRAQRVDRSIEAQDWLSRELASEGGRADIDEALDLALRRQPGEPSAKRRGVHVGLTVAAMRVVSALQLAEHAPLVADWLDPGSTPVLQGAAALQLYRLYGRWYDSSASFAADWPVLRGRAPADTGAVELQRVHEVANDRALALIEFAPEQLGKDALEWLDPAMAARAARALGRAVAGGRLDPIGARRQLSEALAVDRRSDVVHARLETLLDLIQGIDPASDAAIEVRAVLVDVILVLSESGPDSGDTGAAWTILAGLPRLPHGSDAAGDASRAATLGAGVDLLKSTLAGADVRTFDPDAVQGAILALVDLARSIQDVELRGQYAGSLADAVRPLVMRPESAAVRVRRAGALALGLAPNGGDAQKLVGLLARMRTPEIEYELLGALKASLRAVNEDSAATRAVIEALFRAAADPDFDTRTRAFELLSSEDVRPSLDALGPAEKQAHARWLVAGLLGEEAPALQAERLVLIGELGDRDSLVPLTVHPEGAQGGSSVRSPIAELAEKGEVVAEALAHAAVKLAADDVALRTLIARELVATSTPEDSLRVVRRRAALRILLVGDENVVRSMGRSDHAWIVQRALELRHAAPTLAREQFVATAAGACLAQHAEAWNDLPADGTPEAERHRAASDLLTALLDADRLRPRPDAPAPSPEESEALVRRVTLAVAALDRSARAVASPELESTLCGWSSTDVWVEAILLLRLHGRDAEAVSLLDQLLASESLALALLPTSIVRGYAEMVESMEEPTSAQVNRALQFRQHCVDREDWGSRDAGLRLAEVEAIVALARRSGNKTLLRATVARIRSLVDSNAPTAAEFEAFDAERLRAVREQLEGLGEAPAPVVEPAGSGTNGDSEGTAP